MAHDAEVPDVEFELKADANSASFAHPDTGEQVELEKGKSVKVSANHAASLEALPFLKRAGSKSKKDEEDK